MKNMLDSDTLPDGTLNFNDGRPDRNELIETYKQFGRIHIPKFLDSKSAVKIHQTLAEQPEWNLVWDDQGKHTDLSYTGVMDWTDNQRDILQQKIHTQAKRGFQYCYSAIPIFDIYQNKLMPGHFFNEVYEFFNHPKLIAFVRDITGHEAIKYSDMQATRFSKGHFLTEHDDNVRGKNRLAAYVLNLTPEWRDDWGGALLFPDNTGLGCKTFFPKFNALNIFSVPQKHSVSFVTPFAGAQRYSITGWFRY
jgi:SM-20-related protein